MYRRIMLGALTASALALSGPVRSETAARVDFMSGDAVALARDGQSRALGKGSTIEAGDTVDTRNGRVQLRFSDGAFVSLQPQSRFRIDEYHFGGKPDGTERGFFSLLQGGLRTITGLVGRTNKRNYQVSTAVATIGIRGTEYTVSYGDDMRGSVGEGEIVVCNGGGCINVVSGESYFVSGSDTRPTVVQKKTDLPPSQPDGALPSFVAGDQTTQAGTPSGLMLTGTQMLASSMVSLAGTPVLNTNDTVMFASDGSVTSTSAGPLASVTEFGNNGYIAWGRALDQFGLPVAYVTGPATPASELASLAISNPVASYKVLGATTPLVQSLALETTLRTLQLAPALTSSAVPATQTTFMGASLTANFVAASVNATVNVNVGGMNVTGTAPGMALPRGATGPMTFSNSSCASGCNMMVQGMFTGPHAEFAGMTYAIAASQTANLAPTTVVGAVTFAR